MATAESKPLRRALVADDDASARGFFARLLELEGYEVLAASNGIEATEFLSRGPVDIVLSDISMPGMGGIQLLHAVRAVDLDVPVILITGAPTVETAAKAVEYGALRYLVKPVKASEVRELIRYASRLHALARVKREALALLDHGDAATDLAGLEAAFERAVGSLTMVYQPIVRRSTRHTFGYEALARTGETSLRAPTEMLEAAFRLGRVQEFGRAIRAAVARSIASMEAGPLVFVNVDPRELEDESLYDPAAPLSAYAERVVIEFTERARLEDIARLRERVAALRSLGYRFAIDDLGAGYAGLQTFVHIEPEFAKVDMSLVRGVDSSPTKQRIIRSVVDLCTGMSIEVVAEGIETAAEREAVSLLGVDLLQGFLFSRPELEFVRPGADAFGN